MMFQFSHAFSMCVHQNTNTVQKKAPPPPQKDNNKYDNWRFDLPFVLFFVIVASFTVAMKGGPSYFEKDR